jgi:hypothetical protein
MWILLSVIDLQFAWGYFVLTIYVDPAVSQYPCVEVIALIGDSPSISRRMRYCCSAVLSSTLRPRPGCFRTLEHGSLGRCR